MANQVVFILAAFCILAICYIIALKAQPRAITVYETSPERIRRYLFTRFSWPHVTFSTVGSYISFYSVILAAFIFPFGWGALPMLGVALGTVLGFLFLYWRIRAVVPTWKPEQDYTYVDLIQGRIGKKKYGVLLSLFPIALMTIFVIGSVSTEIRSLELFYSVSDMPASELLRGATIQEPTFRFSFFILIACLVYVLRGGFRGVVNTDKLQLMIFSLLWLVCLAWMLSAGLNPFSLIWNQLLVGRDSIIIGINAVLIIGFTIGCILDNWIRSAGTLINHCAAKGIPRSEWLTYIRRSLLTSAVAGSILFAVPGLLGLQARQVLEDVWRDANSQSQYCQGAVASTASGESLAKPYLAGCLADDPSKPPLLPRGQAGGPWLPIKVEDAAEEDLNEAVQTYAAFTNSPLILSSLFMRELFNHSVRTHSEWTYFAAVMLVIAAFLCAVLTTIDSYMVSICQLLSKFEERRSRQTGNGRHSDPPLGWKLLRKPGLIVVLLAIVIVAYSRIEFLHDPNVYISVGFFAYISLIYLFFIAALTTHGETSRSYDDVQPLSVIFFLYLLFVAMFAVHLLLIGGLWNPGDVYFWSFFRSRAYLILFPAGALLLTALYFVWRRKRPSRKRRRPDGGRR